MTGLYSSLLNWTMQWEPPGTFFEFLKVVQIHFPSSSSLPATVLCVGEAPCSCPPQMGCTSAALSWGQEKPQLGGGGDPLPCAWSQGLGQGGENYFPVLLLLPSPALEQR